jgi:hypothetical protein
MDNCIINDIKIEDLTPRENSRNFRLDLKDTSGEQANIFVKSRGNIQCSKYEIKFQNIKFTGNSQILMHKNKYHNGEFDIKINKFITYGGLTIKTDRDKEPIYCSLNCLPDDEGVIKFDDMAFRLLNISGLNKKVAVIINQCRFNELKFHGFTNKGLFKFTDCKDIEKLVIENSDLDEVIFRPLKVNKNNIELCDNSFLGGIKLFGSDIINLDKLNQDDVKQEYYRQLKQAAKNSNNKFLELEYKAKEMEHYKPSQNTDKIVHWFNAINAYGLDWGWPMVAMGIFNFVLWIPFTTLLYSNHFGEFDLFYLCDTLGRLFKDFNFVYFQLLNPISRMSDFSNLKFFPADVSWIVHLLFITSKILNSVFIYQIVTAFRKWVGKE